MAIFDADGHITETQDQVAKYLDDPYRQRALTYGLYPADGWDRRMLNTLGEWGGDAKTWLAAMDRGGVEHSVLYPTLGLFMSFIRDRNWQVQTCRAYNRIYFSCEADEWMMPQAMKLIGDNQIVWASDFPHWDHSFPGSIDEIRGRGDLTDTQKQKVLNDNGRRLYGIK